MLLYLHGFASGPSSTKARAFRERWPALITPDLNQGEGGFSRLTLTRILERIDEQCQRLGADEPLVLFGSSLGGYSAALWQARRRRACALVLLAPAFDLGARWGSQPRHEKGADGFARIPHYAEGRDVPFDEDGFLADAGQYESFPDVATPTLVLHGNHDAVVPVELAQRFRTREPAARLVIFEAGHELTEVLSTLVDEAAEFLGKVAPAATNAFPS
jgi:pimeloyl-ACP methyl ester carboxylesterase